MTLSTWRMAMAFGIVSSALVLAGSASASGIVVVRDVSARGARPLPVKSIQVVRDVSARDAKRRAVKSITVVRDTAARDDARAAEATG
jgi:hypothetical protein